MRRAIVTFALVWALAASVGAANATATTSGTVPLPLCCIPNGDVDALAVDGETAYVGGSFTHLGLPRDHLAVLDPGSGEPQDGWPGVDGGFVRSSVPDGAGGWYLAGEFTSVGGVPRDGLAHLLPDKSVDPGWAPTTDGSVVTIARDTAGVVYIGGAFTEVDGNVPRANFAALDAAGRPTAFTANTDGAVDAIATSFRFAGSPGSATAVPRLYLGGEFTHVAGAARHYFAALDPGTGALIGADPELNGKVTTIAVSGGTAFQPRVAYVGGAFTGMPSLARVHAAAFHDDTATPTDWGPFVDPAPEAIAVGGSNVYLAGAEVVNGTARSGIAAVDPDTGTSLRAWAPRIEAPVLFRRIRSMAVSGGALYLAGTFAAVDGTPRGNLAAFDLASGALLPWDPAPAGLNRGVTTLGSDGAALLVSGEFEEIGGPARHNLAAIDLLTGQVTPFHPDVDGAVEALAPHGGVLYLGGQFAHVGGLARSGAAAVDLSGAPTPFAPQVAGNPVVRALAFGDGTVFLGGPFIQVGGQQREGLAEVDAATGAVTPFHDDADGEVWTLADADGKLYVGGSVQSIGGAPRVRLAQIIPALGGQVTPFDPSFDGTVRALLVRDGALYASGDFHHVLNAIPRAFLATFDLGNLSLLPFESQLDDGPTALADDDSELFVAGGGLTSISGSPRPGVGAIDLASGLATAWAPTVPAGFSVDQVALSREGGAVVGSTYLGRGLLEAFAIAPSTPAAPPAVAAGPGRATVTIVPPPDGGSSITGYTVTASPGGTTTSGGTGPIAVDDLSPGTYTFTASATNAAGQSEVSPPSGPVAVTGPAPGTAAGPASAPASAPTLRAGHFRVTHRRFAVAGGKKARRAGRLPRGTTFSFDLSAAATARIAIARRHPGTKRGRRCVAPHGKPRRHCTRLVTVGTLVRAARAGADKIPFGGRLKGRALHPGIYRATLTATSVAGARTSPLGLTFVVAAAPRSIRSPRSGTHLLTGD
jgi:hypothetical protein